LPANGDNRLRKVGLFGGTFNPVHNGHIRVAQEVRHRFPLDKIYLVPSFIPPHKERRDIVTGSLRHEMVRLAVADQPDLVISDLELRRPGPSYTIDTVRHFQSSLPDGCQLFLIVGVDAFLEIATWRRYHELLQEVPVIVMSRPVEGQAQKIWPWKKLEEYLQSSISKEYWLESRPSRFIHPRMRSIYPLKVTPIPISSTRIRDLVRQRRSIGEMVPQAVEDFIRRKGLYL
jgi:nicotinate-nucleotide adenylyltransferase